MVIIFKLLLFLMFLIFIMVVVKLARWALRRVDEVDVKEKMNIVKDKADLADNVEKFKRNNKTDIKKAESDVVDAFINN